MAKVTLQNQAYRMILERIIRHEFKPGEPMRESKLAAALGIKDLSQAMTRCEVRNRKRGRYS